MSVLQGEALGEASPRNAPGARLNSRVVGLRGELAFGRQQLRAKFRSSPSRILGSRELLVAAVGMSGVIHHLRAGWACQYRSLLDGCRAIVDVYLPGDVIGLDTALGTRPLTEVLTLTSVTVEAIHTQDGLIDLMSSRPTALYIAWLLSQRNSGAARLLAAMSCLDAPGRLAAMILDFYTRLRRRKLITGFVYNLPLTQDQIGNYLGLTDVHVNRVLRSLRDKRIVRVEKHCVTILDLEGLTRLAQHETTTNSMRDIGARDTGERGTSEAAD
jgi:CRP/FNR family transcriptional regulator